MQTHFGACIIAELSFFTCKRRHTPGRQTSTLFFCSFSCGSLTCVSRVLKASLCDHRAPRERWVVTSAVEIDAPLLVSVDGVREMEITLFD